MRRSLADRLATELPQLLATWKQELTLPAAQELGLPPAFQPRRERGMFQLFDKIEALKLDLYPRELVPGELQRSVVVEIFEGVRLPVVSRADAALSKLIWISKGSHKSRRDVRNIYRTAHEADRALIRERATQLNLIALLDEVLAESDEIDS